MNIKRKIILVEIFLPIVLFFFPTPYHEYKINDFNNKQFEMIFDVIKF